ncbi:MAG: 4Fe-4S dicluster domain-containing protein [Deltaproteobacteria bacterium]|nr:4Fe-4S dicluster domain-containing protein [Deltaproteobacteria bacterium]
MDKTPKPLTLSEKLFLVRFRVDSTSHLAVNQEACKACADRACLTICPTEVYRWDGAASAVTVSYEGCLECGTCRIACAKGALTWRNPSGGFGVCYRFG